MYSFCGPQGHPYDGFPTGLKNINYNIHTVAYSVTFS